MENIFYESVDDTSVVFWCISEIDRKQNSYNKD